MEILGSVKVYTKFTINEELYMVFFLLIDNYNGASKTLQCPAGLINKREAKESPAIHPSILNLYAQ